MKSYLNFDKNSKKFHVNYYIEDLNKFIKCVLLYSEEECDKDEEDIALEDFYLSNRIILPIE